MEQLSFLLKKFGLNTSETEIYIATLRLGLQPASVISDHIGFNRVTTYASLKKLTKKGLATSVIRNNTQYFSVQSTEKLMEYANRREQEWRDIKTKLVDAVQEVRVPYLKDCSPLQVQSFQGVEGIRTILQEVLKAKEFFMISRLPRNTECFTGNVWENFLEKAVEYKIEAICVFQTNPFTQTMQSIIEKEPKNTCFLTPDLPFKVEVIIIDDRTICFIAMAGELFSGAMIQNSDLAKNMKDFLKRSFF